MVACNIVITTGPEDNKATDNSCNSYYFVYSEYFELTCNQSLAEGPNSLEVASNSTAADIGAAGRKWAFLVGSL